MGIFCSSFCPSPHVLSIFQEAFFQVTFSVSEEAFYYKEKAYPYSEYLIECDAKLIRFNGGSRGMPYYRIVIINKDTRAEKTNSSIQCRA